MFFRILEDSKSSLSLYKLLDYSSSNTHFAMEKHTIEGLKKTLVASPKFYDIADYFLTITETNMAALDGRVAQNNVLQEILISTLTELARRQDIIKANTKMMTLDRMFMIEVPKQHFWHGSGLINNKYIFTFLYFADLDKGLVSLAKGSNNFFARISAQGLPDGSNPMEKFSDN
jgi:hypothetical protein